MERVSYHQVMFVLYVHAWRDSNLRAILSLVQQTGHRIVPHAVRVRSYRRFREVIHAALSTNAVCFH